MIQLLTILCWTKMHFFFSSQGLFRSEDTFPDGQNSSRVEIRYAFIVFPFLNSLFLEFK